MRRIAILVACITLAGCQTVENRHGRPVSVVGFDWGAITADPASWLTQNVGEVLVGIVAALAGGHAIARRRRGAQPSTLIRRAPGPAARRHRTAPDASKKRPTRR